MNTHFSVYLVNYLRLLSSFYILTNLLTIAATIATLVCIFCVIYDGGALHIATVVVAGSGFLYSYLMKLEFHETTI